MIIRTATGDDINEITAIDYAADNGNVQKELIRKWVTNGNAFVVVLDKNIIAYAVLEYNFFSCGFISMLAVARLHQRKGIATSLVKHLETICNTIKLFTSTNESNVVMQAFLANLSYEPSGIVHNLDEGDPELFYFKKVR